MTDEQYPATTPAHPGLAPYLRNSSDPEPMPKPPTNRAAIYVKATLGHSPDGAEPATQMAEAEEFCKVRHLDVTARYSDEPRDRQQFQRMLGDATGEDPRFDHVVVWKLCYFAWDLDDSIHARDTLAASGVRLLSVKERLPNG